MAEIGNSLWGVRVLVVEDHDDSRDLLGEVLRGYGAVVRTEADAPHALEALGIFRPDVLVSNIAMPGVDGCMLLHQIRGLSAAEGGAIPAIAITGYVRGVDRARMEAAGFGGVVPKPIDPANLRASIERAVGSASL